MPDAVPIAGMSNLSSGNSGSLVSVRSFTAFKIFMRLNILMTANSERPKPKIREAVERPALKGVS